MIFEMGRAENIRFCQVIKMDIDRKHCEAGPKVDCKKTLYARDNCFMKLLEKYGPGIPFHDLIII
jgi:hypothetical protein